jgi:hypothetical protein
MDNDESGPLSGDPRPMVVWIAGEKIRMVDVESIGAVRQQANGQWAVGL